MRFAKSHRSPLMKLPIFVLLAGLAVPAFAEIDRTKKPEPDPAPAAGLCLVSVDYGEGSRPD